MKNKIKGFIGTLTTFEKIWLVVSTLILLAVELYFKDNIIGVICTLTGMLNVVLVAKGSIYNYAFGIINTILYAYIAFNAGYGGDFITFTFYYIPLQFIGIYMWNKKIDKDGEILKANSMNKLQLLLSVALIFIGTYLTMLILPIITKVFGMPTNSLPFIDAFTTFTGIFAGALMIKRYTEQWYIWIFVNIGSVIMWVTMLGQDTSAPAMIIMWTAYLINAIYGAYNWRKMS